MALHDRVAAARHLTEKSGREFKPEALAALATSGRGPPYAFLRGRAMYEEDALDAWLTAQLAAKSPSAQDHDRRGIIIPPPVRRPKPRGRSRPPQPPAA